VGLIEPKAPMRTWSWIPSGLAECWEWT